MSGKHPAVWLAATLAILGCGGGNPVAPLPALPADNPHEWLQETRPLSGVRGVILDMETVCDLRIEQGASESIWIRADETVLPWLDTTVHNGVLELRYPWQVDPSKRPPKSVQLALTVVDLDILELRDNGTISVSRLAVDRLALRSMGAGEIVLSDLSAQELEVEVLAGGGVHATGVVDRQRSRLGGGGAYDGVGLASREADVEISHTGSATVRVSERLRATIRGSGSVLYYGNPEVESLVSGSGEVVRLGD